jgi:undecaprenyl-diphosphatase
VNFLDAIILGIVQGLTEFLPVSSSAHLRVVGELLMPGKDPGSAFTAIIQLGTETAVLIYFWKDITRIIGRWFRALAGKLPHSDPDVRMGWLVIIGSIPIGVLGLLFESQIDYTLRNLYITAGLAMGYTRKAAARYAFLLAIPAVFASGLYKAAKEIPTLLSSDGRAAAAAAGQPGLAMILVATVVSFAIGYAVIVWFMRLIETKSYLPFVFYRIAAGVLLLVLLGTDVLDPLAGSTTS